MVEWVFFSWWSGIHLLLDPSDGVFGRFDLAALCGCLTLTVCLFVMQVTCGGHKRNCWNVDGELYEMDAVDMSVRPAIVNVFARGIERLADA